MKKNNLNKEYFETRKNHESNVSKKAWLYVIPILVGFVLLGTYIVDILPKRNEQKNRKEKKEELTNKLVNGEITKNDTTIIVEENNYKVKLHEGLNFMKNESTYQLFASTLDSTALTYNIAKIPEDFKNEDLKEFYKEELIKSNNTYVFRDSLNFTLLELVYRDIQCKGIFKIVELDTSQITIQATIDKSFFNSNYDKMIELIESIKKI